jgi:hypothetical protein
MLTASEVRLAGKLGHGISKQHRLVVMLRLLPTKILQRVMVLSASVLELLMMLWLVQMLLLGALVRI